jgi:hypothetical protein
MCKVRGTERKLLEFQSKTYPEQVEQAKKGLEYRMRRLSIMPSKQADKLGAEMHREKATKYGMKPPDLVGTYYGNTYITILREYAEALEKEGILKIDRSKGSKIK